MMKKFIRIIFLFALVFLAWNGLYADEPPNPGGGPGSGDLPVGGGSPIGEGLLLTLIFSVFYSIKRSLKTLRKKR